MKSKLCSHAAILLMAGGLAGFAAVHYCHRTLAYTVQRRNQLEQRSTQAATALLSRGSLQQAHAGVIYLPKKLLAGAASLAVGTEIKLPANVPGVPADTRILIDRFVIDTGPGKGLATLGITMSSASSHVSVGLDADGVVRYLGEDTSGSIPMARFGIDIAGVHARASWSLLHWQTRQFTARVLGGVLTRQLAGNLDIGVPLPPVLSGHIQMSRAINAAIPKTGGSVTLALSTQDVPLSLPLTVTGGLFTLKGLYLVADETGVESATVPHRAAAVDIAAFFSGGEYQSPADPDAASLWLRGDFLADSAAQIGKISPAQRTAHLAVTGHPGDLFRSTFQAFGQDGVWVRLGDGGSADISLDGVSSQWKANSGLSVQIPVSVHASSPVSIQMKAVGVSKNIPVGIEGGGALTLNGTIQPVFMDAGGIRCFALKLQGGLQPASLSVSTDGHFIAGPVHMNVAKVSATVHTQVDPNAVPAIVLLTDAPFILPSPNFHLPAGYSCSFPGNSFELVAAPVAVNCGADGVNVALSVKIQRLESSPVVEQGDALRKAQAWAATQVAGLDLVRNPNVDVDAAGMPFGPHNDLVLFIQNPGKRTVQFLQGATKAVASNIVKAASWVKRF